MRRATIALMLLLAAPATAGEEPDLVAHAATATGEVDAVGPLRLMLRENDPRADASFALTAQQLRVEVARADPVVDGMATSGAYDPEVEPAQYTGADVQGTDVRDSQRWLLLPGSATARIEAACLEVNGADSSTVERNPRVGFKRGTFTADTSRTSLVQSCNSDAVLEVQGDFLLVLWEWDVQVHTTQARDDYWSGKRDSNSVPGGVAHEYREVYLHAADALLRVRLAEADRLYVADPSTHIEGNVLLDRATGRVATSDGDIQAAGASVQITGSLDVDVTKQEDMLGLGIGGRIDQLRSGGVLVEPSSSRVTTPLLAGGLILAALVGVGFVASRRMPRHAYQEACRTGQDTWTSPPRSRREERAMGWNVMAKNALDAKHKVRGVLYAHAAVRVASWISDHAWMRRQAHQRLRWLGWVRRDHGLLAHLLTDELSRAENALQAARLCHRTGREDEALKWLRTGREEHVQCLEWAWRDAELKPLAVRAFGPPPPRDRATGRGWAV